MTAWRNIALLLALACVVLLWRDCTRAVPPAAKPAAQPACSDRHTTVTIDGETRRDVAVDRAPAAEPADEPPPSPGGPSINGFQLPAWTAWLAPHPGEDLRAYRDRMLPLAQAAIAPQRARVARSRDDFAAAVHLDPNQRAELDKQAQEAGTAIEDKVLNSLLAGELQPSTFKPMTGVTLARDILDTVDHANQRFLSTLTADQRAALAKHPFDFADYLLFSVRWEDALNM